MDLDQAHLIKENGLPCLFSEAQCIRSFICASLPPLQLRMSWNFISPSSRLLSHHGYPMPVCRDSDSNNTLFTPTTHAGLVEAHHLSGLDSVQRDPASKLAIFNTGFMTR